KEGKEKGGEHFRVIYFLCARPAAFSCCSGRVHPVGLRRKFRVGGKQGVPALPYGNLSNLHANGDGGQQWIGWWCLIRHREVWQFTVRRFAFDVHIFRFARARLLPADNRETRLRE